MRSRMSFLMCLVLALAFSVSAQTRSVTNGSLEAYKQDRLKNEREYRENYERLGLPSPEEIGRRHEQSAKELAELSSKLRAEELERERASSQRVTVLRYRQPVIVGVVDNTVYSYFWRNRGYHWMPRRHQYVQPGYFAGGQFWPTGSATPPRPMFAPHKNK
jgi:hypothetical protein